ncbi:glycosyltransferase family 2 protein [Methylocella silvestris]|uniref:Family 2 glycosyl transferase n=1 Tax=Methylocella silvestris TaxID=199596 RepID=A0A2J7TD79_METSI|nr:glycosyltransferase family 2 protein [Methylocella silvestris]PNG24721.1 family 2 glycosyl transferase [Methylocella silvestris]
MRASVIVRSRNESARLRLTLASLACQSEPAEIVVVNDGSTDETDAVLHAASIETPLVRIDHEQALGRSLAANAGAQRASGDILIFLDGDTLAAPDFVERHLAAHSKRGGVVARGETLHLRQTRVFADPETGSPMPGEEARVAAMPERERARSRVTKADISRNFSSIELRAQPGIYPGAGPRRLYDLEMEALQAETDCGVLWAAASGSNQSVARLAFLEAGGFDPELSINEHREIALRLVKAGLRMALATGARSFHMIHRKGWRDPLVERDWEKRFYRLHPIPETPLLAVLWASLAETSALPAYARIRSLPDLFRAARRCDGVVGIEAVRRAHLAASERERAFLE